MNQTTYYLLDIEQDFLFPSPYGELGVNLEEIEFLPDEFQKLPGFRPLTGNWG